MVFPVGQLYRCFGMCEVYEYFDDFRELRVMHFLECGDCVIVLKVSDFRMGGSDLVFFDVLTRFGMGVVAVEDLREID